MEATSLHDTKLQNSLERAIAEILREELAAKEAYELALEGPSGGERISELQNFKRDHDFAINFWSRQMRRLGGIPPLDSSLWGVTVEAFVGGAKVLGVPMALKALKRGEEYGLVKYKLLFNEIDLTPFQQAEIRNHFIPNQKRHIESLNAVIESR